MANYGLKTTEQPKGQEISTAAAFEMLCAQCLKMESHPAEITAIGTASGWFHRMRMLANNLGWDFNVTIEDLPK